MKQITLHIPDGKLHFFMELLQSLGFVELNEPKESFILSEEQKEIVDVELEKIKNDPQYLLDWNSVKSQLKAG